MTKRVHGHGIIFILLYPIVVLYIILSLSLLGNCDIYHIYIYIILYVYIYIYIYEHTHVRVPVD